MANYRSSTGRTVSARNYKEAAEKLYGQTYYTVKGAREKIPTTYTYRRNGYADVSVYKIGDKQGTYWGVRAATPKRYKITKLR